jgi:calcineurin-like phosphoesterase family protein
MQESLKSRTIKGVGWSAIDNVARVGVTFLVSIILARLLSPDDYGLLGIIQVVTVVSTALINAGFTTALIRKKDATDDDYNTSFIVNLGLSLFIYGIIFLCSPYIADFFNREELISLVARLRGKKILVKGNHDDLKDYRYKQLFEEVCDYKEVTDSVDGVNKKLVLFHYPIYSWKGMRSGTILLYGHTHNSTEDELYQKALKELYQTGSIHTPDKEIKAYNVGCMKPWINYTPRTLKEIVNYQ